MCGSCTVSHRMVEPQRKPVILSSTWSSMKSGKGLTAYIAKPDYVPVLRAAPTELFPARCENLQWPAHSECPI
jgi:hypothetical protein